MLRKYYFLFVLATFLIFTGCSTFNEAQGNSSENTNDEGVSLTSIAETSSDQPITTEDTIQSAQTLLSTNTTTKITSSKVKITTTLPETKITATSTKANNTSAEIETTKTVTTTIRASKDIVQGYVYSNKDSQLVIQFGPNEKVDKITIKMLDTTINSIDNPDSFVWSQNHTRVSVSCRERNPDGSWTVTIGRGYLVTVEGTDLLYDGTYWKKIN